MASQISWLLEERIINVAVEPILRGYAVDQLTRTIKSLMAERTQQRRRVHIVVDVSKMQVSDSNAELLFTALTPFMFEPQIRFLIIYGGSKEMQKIFKSMMYEMFTHPCIVLQDYDSVLEFLNKKDPSLQKAMQRVS